MTGNTMRNAFIFFILLVSSSSYLSAQEATAGLSSPTTFVGQPVEMVITVRDARSADVPQTINVPGLRIELFGRATRFEMNNFKVMSSMTYTYSVTPSSQGDFTIPPVEVKVGNKVLKTNPARLLVQAGGQAPLPPPQPLPQQPPSAQGHRQQPGADNSLPYFGDTLLSKKKAYVGEVVPAELRFYFNTRIGGEIGDRPNFGGEGFTIQKLANVPKREQIVNGENYVVFGFQTAITPAKSGDLAIPAATLEARLQVQGNAPPGFADIFQQFGGVIPPGMFTESRNVAIETKPAQLEVLPLPKEGKPENFSGAIGKFTIETSVSPKKAAPGDPVSLKVVVSGQGNFDAMGAPVLAEDDGWRTYPPTDKIQSADAIHFTGEKTFEFTLIARKDQTQTPEVQFSYFDPATGKYETLTKSPMPVDAKAGSAATTAPSTDGVKAPPASSPSPVPAAPSVASVQAAGSSTWNPLLFRPDFLICNAAIGTIWLLGAIFVLISHFKNSPTGRRQARNRSLKAHLDRLKACDAANFDAEASQCVFDILDSGNDPNEALQKLHSLTETDQKESAAILPLQSLLERFSESKYSARSGKLPTSEERHEVVQALTQLISRHAK